MEPLKSPVAAQTVTPSEDRWATRLRGFGPFGILVMLVVPFAGTAFIGAVLVLVWARLSRTSWREIGYVRPRSLTLTLVAGILFGAAFKFLMKAVVMPLLGADPINQAYHFLAGNRAMLLPMMIFIIAGAGFGEETVYRGFLFERFGKLFGPGVGAKALTVLLTSAWFAAVHYHDQGIFGVEQAAITGLVFGVIFAATGSLFPLMVAHAAFDLTAVAIIYWNLEDKVAHLVFK